MQLQDVEKLIQNDKSETVEFKRSTGQRTTAAKTLCGMLNGTEAMVPFGVTDKGNLAQSTLFDFIEGRKGMNELAPKESGGEFLLYQTEDGQVKLEVRLQNETVWPTQQMMAGLFRTSKQNISYHIHGIYEEGELQPEATVKKYLTVRREGKRDVRRELDFYNLDMIVRSSPIANP